MLSLSLMVSVSKRLMQNLITEDSVEKCKMKKLRRIKKHTVEKMLLEHMLRYPAIRFLFQRITGFPKDMENITEPELSENIRLFIKGLRWEEKKKQ